jgi:hypothetical protein
LFDPSVDGLGTPPAFTAVTAAEGADAFTVWTQGTLFDTTSPLALLPPGATTVDAPLPVARPDFVAGALAVTLSGASTNGADHGELIVSNWGGTVADLDVSAQVAAGGTVNVAVPSGESTAVPGAARYGVALRTWMAGSEDTTTRWVRASMPTDLATTHAASVSLTLP